MYSSLLQHIQRFLPLTKEETHELTSYLAAKKTDKKEFLFQEGQVCSANYFVAEGCFTPVQLKKWSNLSLNNLIRTYLSLLISILRRLKYS